MKKLILLILICGVPSISFCQTAGTNSNMTIRDINGDIINNILSSRVTVRDAKYRARTEFETFEDYHKLEQEFEKSFVAQNEKKVTEANKSNENVIYRWKNIPLKGELKYIMEEKRFQTLDVIMSETFAVRCFGNAFCGRLGSKLIRTGVGNQDNYFGVGIVIALPPKEAESFKNRFIIESPLTVTVDFTVSYRSSGFSNVDLVRCQIMNKNGRPIYIEDSNGSSVVDPSTIANPMSSDETAAHKNTRNGQSYASIRIGNQIWLASDLNDDIPGSYVQKESKMPRWGRFYDWETAKLACPVGYHLPSDNDWTILATYLGGNKKAGGKLKESGKNASWKSPNTGATNETGFTARAAGQILTDGTHQFFGESVYWWSSTEYDSYRGRIWSISYMDSGLYDEFQDKTVRCSVRCLKDN